ncbi:MAG: hypothetical protein EZS28_035953 [Streblomastix strix]|uniref:Uncharacterized protein n=1 Tax=Streblomastix strix TaxID=222440 RepID=A0A5J4UET2_9EUKA|nr:MAG: hypothetical protein EZS28_035953 [Streblomastix strix]
MQTSGPVQLPIQSAYPAQMFQQEQTLNMQVILPIADTIHGGRDIERHQTHQKQMDVSWERSPPSPNINIQFGERLKGHFPRLKERMIKDFAQQHKTAWNIEGCNLVDQKSRQSDPPHAGYAEGNVQIGPFIEANNVGHMFFIQEFQVSWKEYCCMLFKRKPQQSDMMKDSPRSQGRRHDKDKNDRRNRRDGKSSLAFMEQQFDKGEQLIRAPNSAEQQSGGDNDLASQIITIDSRIEPNRESLTSLDMGLERQPANPDSRTQTPHVNISEMAQDKQIFLPIGLQRSSSWTDSKKEEED